MSSSRMEGKLSIARHFFKVMMPGFLTELCIPPAFYRQLGGVKSEEAILRSCKGSWHVQIGKCDKGFIYFKKGWDNFVQQHDLNPGDFAVFEHKGDMHFDVYVFDPSACEKEFPLKLDHEIEREPRGVNIHEHVKHIKRERPTKAAASYSPVSLHFVTTIKACNGRRKSPYMIPPLVLAYQFCRNIPADFLKSNDLSQLSSITLRDPLGKLWSAELRSRKNNSVSYKLRTHMANGWYEFYASNELKEGDVCVFELNHTRRRSKTVVMDVHIFPRPI